MLKFERFDADDHYELVRKWWEEHGFVPVPLDALPRTGLMVGTSDALVCGCWIYATDSSLCYLSMFICDPKSAKEIRNECLNEMLRAAIDLAKALGFKSIMSPVNNPKLIKRLEEVDFLKTDTNVTHMLKVL